MADASVSLDLNAQELYRELQNVTAKFVSFAQTTQQAGEKAGTGFLAGVKGGIGSIGSTISGLFSGIGGQLAGFLSIGAVVAEIQRDIKQGSDIQNTSSRFGLDAEQLQNISNAAKTTGLSMEQVARAMAIVTINSQKALDPTSKQGIAMRQLGIDAQQFSKLKPDDAILRLADAYKESAQDGAAFAAASEIVGRRNTVMIQLFRLGSAAIREQAGEFSVLNAKEAKELHQLEVKEETYFSKLHINIGKAIAGWVSLFDTIRGKGGPNIEDILDKLAPDNKLPTETGLEIKEEEKADKKAEKEAEKEAKGDAKELDREKDKLAAIERKKHLDSLPFEQAHAELTSEANKLSASAAATKNEKDRVELKLQYYDVAKEITTLEDEHAADIKDYDRQQAREIHKEERDISGVGGRSGPSTGRHRASAAGGQGASLVGGSEREAEIQDLFNRGLDPKEFSKRTGRIDARAGAAVVKHGLETGHLVTGHVQGSNGLDGNGYQSTDDFHAQFAGRGNPLSLAGVVARRKRELELKHSLGPNPDLHMQQDKKESVHVGGSTFHSNLQGKSMSEIIQKSLQDTGKGPQKFEKTADKWDKVADKLDKALHI